MFGRDPTHVDSHRHQHRQPHLRPVFRELVEPLGVPLRDDGRVQFVGDFYAQWEWRVTDLSHVSVESLCELLRRRVPPGWTALRCHPGYGLTFTTNTCRRLGLGDRWAYFDAHTARWLGPLGDDAPAVCRSADLLLDISGVNPPRAWWDAIPQRALVDTDPVFTQVRHLQ